MNEIATNSTVDYVIGTLSDGSTVRISKADLAAVVGDYTAKTNDDILLCNNSQVITVTLPSMMAKAAGKIIFVKAINNNIYIDGSVVQSGSKSIGSKYLVSAGSQRIFVCFDAIWIEFKCD